MSLGRARRATQEGKPPRDGFEILVDDDGPGIPAHAFERIFERFYTDRPNQSFGQNSGLGLSISRQIVEAHNGTIHAANRAEFGGECGRRPVRRIFARGVGMTAESAPIHVHASAVALGESGVLIRGASGAGKSSLALALVDAWRRRGDFARLVGDDRIAVRISGGRALISPHRALAGMAEWRGIGLIEQEYEASVVLALIVELEPRNSFASLPRLPEDTELCVDFQGLRDVPLLRLPARETERSVAATMAFMHKVSTK